MVNKMPRKGREDKKNTFVFASYTKDFQPRDTFAMVYAHSYFGSTSSITGGFPLAAPATMSAIRRS